MKSITYCPICNSKQERWSIVNAEIAQFLVERIFNNANSEPVFLIQCKECSFLFFNPRLEQKEMSAIYTNYRDENYQKQRQKYEKGYTAEINYNIGFCSDQMKIRKQNLLNILTTTIGMDKIHDVLDFGGDMGQYIPDEIPEKYVYEISDVQAIKGVTMFKKLPDKKFDFIMCAHVLEHVPAPQEIIAQIKKVSRPDSVIYLEVPQEFYPSNLLKAYGKQILFSYFPWLMAMTKYKPIMHEHINFFSLKSVEKLCSNNSLDILYSQIKKIDYGYGETRLICCLARPNIKNRVGYE